MWVEQLWEVKKGKEDKQVLQSNSRHLAAKLCYKVGVLQWTDTPIAPPKWVQVHGYREASQVSWGRSETLKITEAMLRLLAQFALVAYPSAP